MKKIVLKLELGEGDKKGKQKVMTTASGLSGVESVAMDMKDKKLTITGDIDPVKVVGKLRKICQTEIVTVGPAAKPQEENKNKDDKHQSSKDEKKPGTDAPHHKPFLLPPPQYYYQNYPPPNFQHQPYMYMNMMNHNNYTYPSEGDQDPISNSCVIS